MDEREEGPEGEPSAPVGDAQAPTDGAGPAAQAPTAVDGANGTAPGTAGSVGVEAEALPSAADVAELERLQAELNGINDRYLRLAAEFDNYRKRIERERTEQHTRSQAELARRLLDVLDDLQRVEHLDPATATTQSLFEALELLERKFRVALETAGLEEVAAPGDRFDPRWMEAVMTVPTESPEEDDTVADVFRKGYRFGNTLVRPAQVRVKKSEV